MHNSSFDNEKERIEKIRDRIQSRIGDVSPTYAYELAQLLGLISQIARTKIGDGQQRPMWTSKLFQGLFGDARFSTPRDELLQMIDTVVTVLTDSNNEEQPQRLIFARDIRQQVDAQSRFYPNPFASLFRQYVSLEDGVNHRFGHSS